MKNINNKLKTISLSVILAVVAIGFGSCTKEHALQGDPNANQIEFKASMDGQAVVGTRAAGVDADLTANGFYLAGYHTQGKIDATHADAYPNVFDKEVADQQIAVPLVKYENNKFTLKTIKWLLDDVTYLSFFGWSQSKPFATTVNVSTTGIIGQTYDISDKGYPWIDIRNADAPLDQSDIVGSRSIDHKNDAVISAVDLDFQHLLSKLTFKAKSSKKANITITAVNVKYAANKVRKKARYTFGSDPTTIGTYSLDASEFQAGTAPLGGSYPSITDGVEVVLGSVLLVPQALTAGDVSIELKYKLSPNSGDIAGEEQTKTLPLSDFTFEQGNNYAYSIDIQATDILVLGNPVIEDWNIVPYTDMPIVPGPKGDVLLLLDGYDKPYQHTDGKWYWLDRSGYNRHCEIVGYTDGMYSSLEHLYNLINGRYVKVPALPSVTALSMDVVCKNGLDDDQRLLSFIHQGGDHTTGSFRKFHAHFGFRDDKTIHFDTEGIANSGRLQYKSWSEEILAKLMWSFQKADKGNIVIYVNGQERAKTTHTGSSVLGELVDNRIGGDQYQGSISYVKITRGIAPQSAVEAEYLAQNKRHQIDIAPLPPYNPQEPTADQIVEIDGLKWTTGNLVAKDAVNAKVGAPEDGGLYFQFGSLIGWKGGANGDGTGRAAKANDSYYGGATFNAANEVAVAPKSFSKIGDIGTTWPNQVGSNLYYFGHNAAPYETPGTDIHGFAGFSSGLLAVSGVGDPCRYYLGGEWRMPTRDEFKAMNDVATKSWTGSWSAGASVDSYLVWAFAGGGELKFPAVGTRHISSNGAIYYVGYNGYYWSSSVRASGNGYLLYFGNGSVDPQTADSRRYGFPVRCVSGTYVPPIPTVEVAGTKWATGNLVADGANGAKIGTPGDGGLYFQYGGLIGYKGGATGDGTGITNTTTHPNGKWWNGAAAYSAADVAVKPATYLTQATWPYFNNVASGGFGYYYFNAFVTKYADFQSQIGANNPTLGIGDPCAYYLGSPWRLPKYDELSAITGSAVEGSWVPWSTAGVTGKWTSSGPQSTMGAWFGPNSRSGTPTINTDLFIPASGYRINDTGAFYTVGTYGYLWSSSVYDLYRGFYLATHKSNGVYPRYASYRALAFPVRCVQDK